MEGFRKLTVLFSVLLVSIFVQNGESCSCYPADHHTKFCYSPFAAVVTIKDKSGFMDKYTTQTPSLYRVEVNNILNIPENTDVAKLFEEGSSNYVKLYTAPYSSLCGVTNLEIGETYLIGGQIENNKIDINTCGLVVKWNSFAVEEQRNILENYLKNCAFEAEPIFGF